MTHCYVRSDWKFMLSVGNHTGSDEKLLALKKQLGDEVYKAVTTTLMEIKEYNPSGRYVIPELCNFMERRKAILKEFIQYILKQ